MTTTTDLTYNTPISKVVTLTSEQAVCTTSTTSTTSMTSDIESFGKLDDFNW